MDSQTLFVRYDPEVETCSRLAPMASPYLLIILLLSSSCLALIFFLSCSYHVCGVQKIASCLLKPEGFALAADVIRTLKKGNMSINRLIWSANMSDNVAIAYSQWNSAV